MADKNLVILVAASQEYMRHVGDDEKKYAAQLNRLFESISDIYLPLIHMCESLERDRIPFRMALVLPPVLCTLLDDPVVQTQYIGWLNRRIEFGKLELKRCAAVPGLIPAVKFCFERAQEDRISFIGYGQKLLKKFAEYQRKGNLELLATCGTDIFLPHYSDMEEIMNAQVETGLCAHRVFFGETPEGFWLPELGYADGVEKVLRAYGVNYTVLDTRSFLFSEIEPAGGIFRPARCGNSLVVFGRDPESDREIFGENGFAGNPIYLDQNRDVGFELPGELLESYIENGGTRYASGYKYWSRGGRRRDAGRRLADPDDSGNIYDAEGAAAQCAADAAAFLRRRTERLSAAEGLLPDADGVSLVCTVDANRLLANWFEGICWLENVFREGAKLQVNFAACGDLIGKQFELQKIRPYYGSCDGAGYGENLLSHRNSWMMRYVRKASGRMVDLADRFPGDTGLKGRLLNMGAKELMLAQSCGWAKMLNEGVFPEYAETRFRRSIADFTAVFDALGSNTVSTEWLTQLESEHPLFPWMNYRIFSRKR